MELDVVVLETDYGITLDPDIVAVYDGKPYLAVEALEVVD